MSHNYHNLALISDFDGTITTDDFFHLAIKHFLHQSDLQSWNHYLDRKISHFEAISGIFDKIHIPEQELIHFIQQIPVQEFFVETFYFCKKNNIRFIIISAGASYYIEIILKHLNILEQTEFYANNSYYNQKEGLILIKPDIYNIYYSKEYGVSKKKCVELLKHEGYHCIFAGDGGPDLKAAKVADIVFARGRLKQLCDELNIPYHNFYTYNEIYEFLKNY